VSVAIAVAGLIGTLLLVRLDYEMRWYKVSDRSLRIREGVWKVREMTMTFANIQNVSISQGPLQRLFGIADLEVRSAGGGGHQQQAGQKRLGAIDMHVARFRGVDNAEEIRTLMGERLRHYRDAGLGDQPRSASPVPTSAQVPASAVSALSEVCEAAAGLRHAAEELRAGA